VGPRGGIHEATPTDVVSPTDWTDNITNGGKAIQWVTTSPIAPGDTVSGFEFDSTMTPADFEGTVPSGTGAGDPVSTAFVYIAAPLADPGFQLTATPKTMATPEPGTVLTTTLGFALIALFAIRRRRKIGGFSAPVSN
jgi:hypothetical protein